MDLNSEVARIRAEAGVGDPHQPFSDYEPKEMTAEELAKVGVSIAGVQGSLT